MSIRLSRNFVLSEFTTSQTAARRGIDNTPRRGIINNLSLLSTELEIVRKVALGGHSIIITSGYRSPELNAAIGGSRTSDHMTGFAADFICPSFGTPRDVFEAIREKQFVAFDQLILEFDRWVHFSISTGPRYQALVASRVNNRTQYEEAA